MYWIELQAIWPGGRVLGLIFAGNVPLAFQSPYPIIVNPIVKMRSHPVAHPYLPLEREYPPPLPAPGQFGSISIPIRAFSICIFIYEFYVFDE